MNTTGTTARRILADCRGRGIGLPAFNYSDIWDLMAIVNAAGKMKVDVMVAGSQLTAQELGVDVCQKMVDAMDERSTVSIINHLDHSSSVDLCIKAVDAGYPSVMIDGSRRSLEENISMTGEVVRYAHRKGVIVEAEIGKIKGYGIEGDFQGGAFMAEVDEAVELVGKTGVDSLAVGIGTAHGFYTQEPKIHFDRLEELAAAVDVPLVLHGGTGIPNGDIQKALRLGITKVNVGTAVRNTYLNSLRDELIRLGDHSHMLDMTRKIVPRIEAVIIDRIRVISMTDGQAP